MFSSVADALHTTFEVGKGLISSAGGDIKNSFVAGVDVMKAGAKAMGVDLDGIMGKLFGGAATKPGSQFQATAGTGQRRVDVDQEDPRAEHGGPGAARSSGGVEPGWRGFRRLRVTATHHESPEVLSIRLEADDGGPLGPPLPHLPLGRAVGPDAAAAPATAAHAHPHRTAANHPAGGPPRPDRCRTGAPRPMRRSQHAAARAARRAGDLVRSRLARTLAS